MTRLTGAMIKEMREGLLEVERKLLDSIGMDLHSLAYKAADLDQYVDISRISAAIIPITSGKGVTPGFAPSIRDILTHVGMEADMTRTTDVTGFVEAVNEGYDLAFMADDEKFIAYSIGTWNVVDNAECTALGFVQAMEEASGGLWGRPVLVIGLGRVGNHAVHHLISRGAIVSGLDIDPIALDRARARFGIECTNDPHRAIPNADLIFHACPGMVDGDLVKTGAIISAPGVPFGFDSRTIAKAGTVMHDMLPIGVAVMAAKAVKSTVSGLDVKSEADWRLIVND
ncbi:MAG: 3-methylornithyl-N6-L-lysine dehydrogenase PylD [Methanomassiliicoccales archaeon]|nr:3-methylornithyl-N6-L-lysine dehydrogenase PylD [Methanomassiliicoccales archaeon]TFG55343.1 MAG: 3-methylornithyl-N6-L-lysine dehydrogenase PylD [Methanomassiliicoccus sp.]